MEKKTILVIEDEFFIRDDLVKTLSLSGYNTIEADNGSTGLFLAKEHKPDLIISDIMMPKMDGYAVLHELQRSPETSIIPFLFLSAKSDKVDIKDGMNLGADYYITKPYDIDELLEAINSRISKRERNEAQFNQKIEDLRSNIRMAIPHEIRTPMNIILGLSEFLYKKYEVTSIDDAKEMLKNIYDGGQRLNHLFENYLFYANLEIIASDQRAVDNLVTKSSMLSDFFFQEIASMHTISYERTDDLEFDICDGKVQMAEDYFMKIVEEIIDNCFKFSNINTPVKISSSQDDRYYSIQFTDYGRGMSKEQIENLGAYSQFDRKIYEQQGSGLGIAIAKRLVELHQGTFEIDSTIGEQTTVKISLLRID